MEKIIDKLRLDTNDSSGYIIRKINFLSNKNYRRIIL